MENNELQEQQNNELQEQQNKQIDLNGDKGRYAGLSLAKSMLPDIVTALLDITKNPKASPTAKVMALSKVADIATLELEDDGGNDYAAPTIIDNIKK